MTRAGYNKYGAKKTAVDGIMFDSKREADRYCELLLLQKAGEIENLELQPAYECVVNGKKICTYRADFRYDENGVEQVVDVKGMRTPTYKLKKKLVEALFDITIQEV